jgi:hypothetical protein
MEYQHNMISTKDKWLIYLQVSNIIWMARNISSVRYYIQIKLTKWNSKMYAADSFVAWWKYHRGCLFPPTVKHCGMKGMNIPAVKELGTEMKVPTPCYSSVPRQWQDCMRAHTRTHAHTPTHTHSAAILACSSLLFNYHENQKSYEQSVLGIKSVFHVSLPLSLPTFFALITT